MSDLVKGTILGDTYEIIEEIGSGGGGVVFKARHLRLQTDVVVKKIKDEVKGKIKSRQEADILKTLKHPYLPRVYDFIETDDAIYTVMDFIHGKNMEDAVKEHGKYTQKQVRKWAEQLGEALDYLHSQKPPIIHSDIKPANIMLTNDGDICLIDFNVSLAIGEEMESAVGISAGFSPPEQYRDTNLYAKITHNYTLQKSLQVTKKDNDDKTEVTNNDTDDKTELINTDEADDKTELINADTSDDKTELINNDEAGGKVNDKTEVLINNQNDNKKELSETDKKNMVSGNLPQYTQFMGKGIDARSDIYSLGMTLCFLLTGASPSVDFDKRILLDEADAFVSEGFSIILHKMTALSPNERYKNGSEYLKAVQNCYKLDRRYISMHRKQMGIQAAALACLFTGVLTISGGLYKIRLEKNEAYYTIIQNAENAISQQDYNTANTLIDEAIKSEETRIEAYERDVYLLYLSENYEECIEKGQYYINTIPFQLDSETNNELYGNIHYIVGNAYFETEDYPNAKNLFEYALEYNKKNGLYYRDYAITLAKLGQIENAQKQLDEGIKLGIAQDSVYMAQGEIAHVKGQQEKALEYLDQAIMTTSDMQMKKRAVLLCVDVYKTIGNSALSQEVELLEQYVSQFDGNGKLVMTEYLADAYTRMAQTDENKAQEYYKKALNLFKTIYDNGYITYQLQQNMAILYQNMDMFDEAESLLLQMAKDYPENYMVYKRLAYLEADKQQMKENIDRDYLQMSVYYDNAKEKYSGKEHDMEMDMLDIMMQELKDGGWF